MGSAVVCFPVASHCLLREAARPLSGCHYPRGQCLLPPTSLPTPGCTRRRYSSRRCRRRCPWYLGIKSVSACSRLSLETHSGPIQGCVCVLEGRGQLLPQCSCLSWDELDFLRRSRCYTVPLDPVLGRALEYPMHACAVLLARLEGEFRGVPSYDKQSTTHPEREELASIIAKMEIVPPCSLFTRAQGLRNQEKYIAIYYFGAFTSVAQLLPPTFFAICRATCVTHGI